MLNFVWAKISKKTVLLEFQFQQIANSMRFLATFLQVRNRFSDHPSTFDGIDLHFSDRHRNNTTLIRQFVRSLIKIAEP